MLELNWFKNKKIFQAVHFNTVNEVYIFILFKSGFICFFSVLMTLNEMISMQMIYSMIKVVFIVLDHHLRRDKTLFSDWQPKISNFIYM